jgi:hypothetical protein
MNTCSQGKTKPRWPSDLMESLVLWLCHDKPFPCAKESDGSKACVRPQQVASLATYEDRADDLKDDLMMSMRVSNTQASQFGDRIVCSR